MSEAPALRIVPGAPPPAPLSKSQKKKRRAGHGKADENDFDSPITNGLNSALDSALVETAPATKGLPSSLVTKPEDLANAAIASEAAADAISATSILPAATKRTSAVVELVNKRHRTLHKKIQRIKEYSAKAPETLNEDQKKSLATLPALEASSKEVEAVREAIESHEADEAANESRRLAEIESIVKQRIADAVSEARSTAVSRAVQLVLLIRELPQLSKSTDEDGTAVAEFEAALQETDQDKLETTVGMFIAGNGGFSRLIGILNAHLNAPPRTATPVAEELPEPEYTHAVVTETPAIVGIPAAATVTTGGSYHFMQESELEPSTPFDEGAEWVEHSDAPAAPAAVPPAEVKQNIAKGPIDWAAEDTGDLPPISGLQEHFGASGQATPTADAPVGDLPADSAGWSSLAEGGDSKEGKEDESDGFTTIPNKRGHGSEWRGGERGRGRGGYRGRGYAGSGGEGFRGRGGYRGGDDRGRGDYRGRPRGEWRGRGDRARGEGRGEGKGYRGRGQAEGQ
ncbi:hypothetical protein FS842_000400 [Serendipita sp. 407]|nr:hypothetical protein FS842_000400 [Serendipita sp. 407]